MVSGWIVLPMWYFEQGLRIKSVAATTRLGLDDAMQLFFSSCGSQQRSGMRWKLKLSKEKPIPCSVIRTRVMRMLFRIRFAGYS